MSRKNDNVADSTKLCMDIRASLYAALNSCPAHYTDAAAAKKLRTTKQAIRLMKELYQTL